MNELRYALVIDGDDWYRVEGPMTEARAFSRRNELWDEAEAHGYTLSIQMYLWQETP